MAGSRLSRQAVKDDTKKRKRDVLVVDGDVQSKRPKAHQREAATAAAAAAAAAAVAERTGDRRERRTSTKTQSNGSLRGMDGDDGNKVDVDVEVDVEVEGMDIIETAAAMTNGDRSALSAHPDNDGAGWRISKPMGGRMLDVDPILTVDEQHLILTYNTSIQVYTTTDSLLLRRIPITSIGAASSPNGITPAHIVSTRLSRSNPDYLWVACSDAHVYHVNWKTPDEEHQSFRTASGTLRSLAVLPGSSGREDVVLVAVSDKPHRMDLVAYGTRDLASPLSKNILSLKKPGNGLQLIDASQDGQVLVGALNDRLFLGVATHAADSAFEQLQYNFFSWDVPDIITSLDFRVYPRSRQQGGLGGSKDRREAERVVDVLVGGARGAIYVYHDAVSRSQALGKPGSSQKEGIQPQKLHWHRKAVHAVKWSLDGNYIISGGSEQVLVIWQLDTSKKDFLPHLSGSVENIVVSASGSSYVLHLDDNSAMIISTAEMKPTAYISGIQSAALDVSTPKDLLVQRVWTAPKDVYRPIPAAIRPTEPSKLHVCVGNGRQATMTGGFSAPLLQSFDLESFTSVSRQALARTQPTDVNITNKGHPIDEPLITHIAFSGDGKWLASVDDWSPSPKDVEGVGSEFRDQFIRERHEVYLKFWQVGQAGQEGEEQQPIALVSRMNAPHATAHPEKILDLASNSATACFATVGADGMVRLWRPRAPRQQGKEARADALATWGCVQVIPVGDHLGGAGGAGGAGTSGCDGIIDAAAAEAPHPAAPPMRAQGSVAFSEDGSTVFAAFSGGGGGADDDTGLVHVINASTGEIVKTLEGLWKGNLQSVRTLSQYVVVLSDELCVYDVVSDDLRYGIAIPAVPGVDQLLQLAVDPASGYFAVTLPLGEVSSVGIFHPEVPEPIIVRSTPHRIVSLVSSPGTSGFIALDDAAQVWVISEGTDPAASLAAAQPLQDLGLDDEAVASLSSSALAAKKNNTLALLDGAGSDDEMDMAEGGAEDENDGDGDGAAEDVDMADDDAHTSVIAQQQLADIFDAAPAFAAVSVEDMFYKVTSLLVSKPLSASTTA